MSEVITIRRVLRDGEETFDTMHADEDGASVTTYKGGAEMLTALASHLGYEVTAIEKRGGSAYLGIDDPQSERRLLDEANALHEEQLGLDDVLGGLDCDE